MIKRPPRFAPPCPETRWVENLLGLVALWWTFLLTIPADLFSTNLSFLGLSRSAPEWVWACGTLTASALLLWPSGSPPRRWLGLLASAFVYGFISGGITLSSPHFHGVPVNTGFGCYGAFVVFSGAAMFRLSVFVYADLTAWHLRRILFGKSRRGASRKRGT